MTAAEYESLIESRRCVDCYRLHWGRRVRCDDCNAFRNDRDAARYSANKQPCGVCHELGHNRRRCPQAA